MPEFSVIVPVYNVAAYLPRCLDSLLAQTFEDYEVIVVNDGSTDESPAILREYEKKDPRIHGISQANGGLSAARNTGILAAQGQYFCFVDSDDFVEKDLLAAGHQCLSQTNADFISFDYYQYHVQDGSREIISSGLAEGQVYTLAQHPEIIVRLKNAAWNKFYARSLFQANDIWYPPGSYYEDLGTTYRLLARAERICFLHQPYYNYLVDRPGNITLQFNQRTYQIFDMIQMVLDDYRTLGLDQQYYEELKYLGGVNILECLKKTRSCADLKADDAFIDAAFAFLQEHWPEFPACRYPILQQKHDAIYASPRKLKAYLRLRRLRRGK